MEHIKVIRSRNFQTVKTKQLDMELLKNSSGGKWYVLSDNGILTGYIGKKEYNESVRQNRVIINKNFIYLTESLDDEEKARDLFRNSVIPSIPVISQEGRLLYEFIKDREAFYDELKIECGINREDKRRERVIVSMTSHGKRLNTVYLAIKSIMYQTFKADRIVLYLDTEDSDKKVPKEEELVEAGLTIIRNVQDLGPHKKYYQAMSDYKDSIIITVDDDALYDDTLLEELYEKHLEFPDAVVCRWGTRIKKREGALEAYNLWEDKAIVESPQIDICAIGVGGCLYPCGSYREKFLDINGIVNYCFGADDLWLKVIEVINGIKTVTVDFHPIRIIRGTQDIALSLMNCIEERNDKYISDIQEYLNIDLCEYL